jgi:hypothetical protein
MTNQGYEDDCGYSAKSESVANKFQVATVVLRKYSLTVATQMRLIEKKIRTEIYGYSEAIPAVVHKESWRRALVGGGWV